MFLDGDLHLTAAGQQVVAQALAATLAQPAPVATPFVGLPEGRSRLPEDVEWEVTPEVFVKGSSKNNCSTKQIREYLRVQCETPVKGLMANGEMVDPNAPAPDGAPGLIGWDVERVLGPELVGLHVLAGPEDRVAEVGDGSAELVIPLLPGREVVADFEYEDRVARLTVPPGLRAEGEPVGTFEDRAVTDDMHIPYNPKVCDPGQVRGGAALACLELCEAGHACSLGTCTDWLGLNLCI